MTVRQVTNRPFAIAQQLVTIREPIVTNQSNYRVIGNSIILKNTGTAEVVIDNGWTLASGEAIAFNCPNAFDVLVQNFTIIFDGVGVNRLEVAVIETANCPEIDNYIQNINIR